MVIPMKNGNICFKSTISLTPIQYVRQYRIQKAAEPPASTNLKVTDIGTLCGFQEMNSFAKTFRKLKGVTPSKFREHHSLEHTLLLHRRLNQLASFSIILNQEQDTSYHIVRTHAYADGVESQMQYINADHNSKDTYAPH